MRLSELARAFSALASEDRLRILGFLLEGELPRCGELAQRLQLSNPAISYHLRTLETAGLVVRSRRGRHRCLRLTPRLGKLLAPSTLNVLKKEVENGGA
jgi:DNA-binding transcriptional ArsR family regulator